MGGASDGLFFDGGQNFDRELATISLSDVEDIRNTHPSLLQSMVERAYEAENPELAIFVTGIMAARALEPVMTFGALRRSDFERAVIRLLPNMNPDSQGERRAQAAALGHEGRAR